MIHEGIAQRLGAAVEGLAYSEATSEGNVFIDHLPEAPDRAVAVYVSPGVEPDAKLPFTPVGFQVVTRGTLGDAWPLTMSDAILSAIHALRHVTLPDGTVLVYALAQQGTPTRLGPDENGRPRYSTNYAGEVRQVTSQRGAL